VGMAALLGVFPRTTEGEPMGLAAATLPNAGLQFAQLALVVLGVLVITAEYSSGQIRSTLVAVPARVPVLAAKAMGVGAV
ncbi:MAG TPA: ABC transporter permease, partial [Actinotalea sp.]|nr:ABC transporter permease [Actinotalea sp.]